jgi:hypothetical protein
VLPHVAHLIDLLEAEPDRRWRPCLDCRWRFSLIHSVRLPLHELAPSERHTQVEAAGRQQALDTRRVTAHDRVVSTTSYAPITPAELEAVLMRLAELAREDGVELRLRITGGAVMMMAFNARKLGTRDVDVLSAQPSDRLAKYAAIIASERGWPENWLNDSAKKFEQDAAIPDNEDVELRSEPGLRVTRLSLRRLLAWKLARYASERTRMGYNLEDVWEFYESA